MRRGIAYIGLHVLRPALLGYHAVHVRGELYFCSAGQAQIELFKLQSLYIIVCRIVELSASVSGHENDTGDVFLAVGVCNGGSEVQIHALIVPVLVSLRAVIPFNGIVHLAADVEVEGVAAAEEVYGLVALGDIIQRILHQQVGKYGRAGRLIRGIVERIARRGRSAGGV